MEYMLRAGAVALILLFAAGCSSSGDQGADSGLPSSTADASSFPSELSSALTRLQSGSREEIVATVHPATARKFGGGEKVVPAGTTITPAPARGVVAGDAAAVPATISAPGKPTKKVTLYLLHEDGDWQLVATGPAA